MYEFGRKSSGVLVVVRLKGIPVGSWVAGRASQSLAFLIYIYAST